MAWTSAPWLGSFAGQPPGRRCTRVAAKTKGLGEELMRVVWRRAVLDELRVLWETKLAQTGALDAPPAAPQCACAPRCAFPAPQRVPADLPDRFRCLSEKKRQLRLSYASAQHRGGLLAILWCSVDLQLARPLSSVCRRQGRCAAVRRAPARLPAAAAGLPRRGRGACAAAARARVRAAVQPVALCGRPGAPRCGPVPGAPVPGPAQASGCWGRRAPARGLQRRPRPASGAAGRPRRACGPCSGGERRASPGRPEAQAGGRTGLAGRGARQAPNTRRRHPAAGACSRWLALWGLGCVRCVSAGAAVLCVEQGRLCTAAQPVHRQIAT